VGPSRCALGNRGLSAWASAGRQDFSPKWVFLKTKEPQFLAALSEFSGPTRAMFSFTVFYKFHTIGGNID